MPEPTEAEYVDLGGGIVMLTERRDVPDHEAWYEDDDGNTIRYDAPAMVHLTVEFGPASLGFRGGETVHVPARIPGTVVTSQTTGVFLDALDLGVDPSVILRDVWAGTARAAWDAWQETWR